MRLVLRVWLGAVLALVTGALLVGLRWILLFQSASQEFGYPKLHTWTRYRRNNVTRALETMQLCREAVYSCPSLTSCLPSDTLHPSFVDTCLAGNTSTLLANRLGNYFETQPMLNLSQVVHGKEMYLLWNNATRLTDVAIVQTTTRLDAYRLALELIKRDSIAIVLLGNVGLPRRFHSRDLTCHQCHMIYYQDSAHIFLPGALSKRFLEVFAFALYRLPQANVDLLFMEIAQQIGLQVLYLPPAMQLARLNLCDGTGVYYACTDNPTCDMEADTCLHKGQQVVFSDSQDWKQFYSQIQLRKRIWNKMLQRMQLEQQFINARKRLLVMSFNIGFAHLFANWLCALQANGVNIQYIQQHTLVLATDQAVIDYVTKLGFFAPRLDELEVLKRWTTASSINPTAAKSFGFGAHKKINLLLKFSLPLDLITLGYSLVIQDVDLVWTTNVFDLLFDKYCMDDNCDAVFIRENRRFAESKQVKSWMRTEYAGYPEANTGLFLLKPSLTMQSFLQVLLESSRLQQWYSRDQVLWNTLLYHTGAPHVRFRLLPANVFVPGTDIRQSHVARGNTLPTVKQGLAAIHASDTSSFEAKYHRLVDVGHWYFTPECGRAYAKCANITECFRPFSQSLVACRSRDLACLASPPVLR